MQRPQLPAGNSGRRGEEAPASPDDHPHRHCQAAGSSSGPLHAAAGHGRLPAAASVGGCGGRSAAAAVGAADSAAAGCSRPPPPAAVGGLRRVTGIAQPGRWPTVAVTGALVPALAGALEAGAGGRGRGRERESEEDDKEERWRATSWARRNWRRERDGGLDGYLLLGAHVLQVSQVTRSQGKERLVCMALTEQERPLEVFCLILNSDQRYIPYDQLVGSLLESKVDQMTERNIVFLSSHVILERGFRP